MATISVAISEGSDTSLKRRDAGTQKVLDRKTVKARHHDARDKRFIGWDGEGCTIDGVHHYQLFGNSDGLRIKHDSLTWEHCFALIMASPADAIHVIFAGTYDVVMMIRTLPTELCERILKGNPTYVGQYRVHFFRGKYLRIKDRQSGAVRTIYDVFSFFGCSFVKACEQYLGGSDVLEQIAAMKMRRSSFTSITDDVEAYMSQELDLLVLLVEMLRTRLAAVDIYPRSWHGPGAVAATILASHGIKQCKGNYSDDVRRCIEAAYYGGRFEQFKRGNHNGPVYEYDIRSAYPSAMRHLPDLANVVWHWRGYGKGAGRNRSDARKEPQSLCATKQDIGPYSLCRLRGYRLLSDPTVRRYHGALPWRSTKGSIYYPNDYVDGWYWGIEVPSYLYPFIVETWTPEGDGMDYRPFAWVEEMYDRRAALKKAGRPEQLALKLGLNSLYGKLAQSKGAREHNGVWKYPTFHETAWAGWITAYTRAKLRSVMDRNSDCIIAVETDALFSTEPLDLRIGTALGEWEEQTFSGIMYLQSGVYFVRDESGDWSMKSRGFAPTGHTPELWTEHLKGLPHGTDTGMAVSHHRFGTVPTQKTFAQWYGTDHVLSLDGTPSKRIHDPYRCTACESGLSYAETLHSLYLPKLEGGMSTPYPFPWTDPTLLQSLNEEYELTDWMEPT